MSQISPAREEAVNKPRGKRQAMPHRDMAVLDRIYADDMAFAARGKVITKDQHVVALRPRDNVSR